MRVSLSEAVALLKSGTPVAFPTETVYGLGALAMNTEAVLKIFATKGRPSDNPLIVHVDSLENAEPLVSDIPPLARQLAFAFWPGPLAIILPKKPSVPDVVTAGLPKVAIRCPDHALALELIVAAGALAAPSANKSGRPSPTRTEHVEADFGADFPVLDGGPCRVGIESTVVDLTTIPPKILRPGAISAAMLKNATGVSFEIVREPQVETASPGMKYTHYAPKAKVSFWNGQTPNNAMLLALHAPVHGEHDVCYSGDIERMARELFDRFRQADYLGLPTVLIERFDAGAGEIAAGLLNRIEKAIAR